MFDLTWPATSPKLPTTDAEKKFVSQLEATNQTAKTALDSVPADKVCQATLKAANSSGTLANGAVAELGPVVVVMADG